MSLRSRLLYHRTVKVSLSKAKLWVLDVDIKTYADKTFTPYSVFPLAVLYVWQIKFIKEPIWLRYWVIFLSFHSVLPCQEPILSNTHLADIALIAAGRCKLFRIWLCHSLVSSVYVSGIQNVSPHAWFYMCSIEHLTKPSLLYIIAKLHTKLHTLS